MTQAEYVIEKFGGVTAMSRKLRHRNRTTVKGWVERGFIPPKRYDEILRLAQTEGVSLTREDFVAHLAESVESRVAA